MLNGIAIPHSQHTHDRLLRYSHEVDMAWIEKMATNRFWREARKERFCYQLVQIR